MAAGRAERVVPAVAGALVAAPVLAFTYPPMTDLPLHEGMVALLVRWHDPTFVPPRVYELNLGHADQLFYALAYPLALALGSAAACKIVVAATIAGTVVASGRLADHIGATRWASLLVVPAVLGWAFFYGFVANLVGCAVFLAVLPVVDRFALAPTRRGVVAVCATVIVAHLAHETALAALCLALVVLSVGRPLDRRWLARLLPLGLAGVLVAMELRLEAAVLTAYGHSFIERGLVFHGLWDKLVHAPALLLGTESPVPIAVVAALVGGSLALASSARKRVPAAASKALAGLSSRRFELLAAALLVGYLALPYAVNFGAWLFARLLAPAYAIGVLVLSRGAAPPSSARRALYGSVVVAWVFLCLPEFGRAEAANRSLTAVLDAIQGPSSVALLGLARRDNWNVYDTASAGNRVLAVRGGRMLHSFAEYPIAPVVVKSSCRWDDAVMRIGPAPLSFRPGFDSTRFGYALVYAAGGDQALVEAAFAPDERLVVRDGPWQLFRSADAPVALDAPDGRPPIPAPSTLSERIARPIGRSVDASTGAR